MKKRSQWFIVLVLALSLIAVAQPPSVKIQDEVQSYCKDLPFNMSVPAIPTFPDRDFNITKFGALGDGLHSNTEAFRRAIEECSKAGGGRVVVPSGMWLTGPITMRSNVNLHLETGALIQFSGNFDEYPLVDATYEGQPQLRCTSPLNGNRLENIAVTGEGVIDGAGEAWRPVKKFKMTATEWKELVAFGGVVDPSGSTWWPSEQAMNGESNLRKLRESGKTPGKKELEVVRDYLRPVMVSFVECRNVLLDGPTFQNSPAWNIHPLLCENVVVRNITVRNPWYSQNGDGIDLESCRNVVLYRSNFDVGDDAICLKSGRDEFGRKRGRATENVVIADCVVYHGHGGFTIGSEMSGGVRNIKVVNCLFIGTDVGLRFKSTRGRGGVVENIHISDVVMKHIPTSAIDFNLYYGGKAPTEDESAEDKSSAAKEVPVTEQTPRFRDIYLKNISCTGARDAVILQGLPEMPLSNISLDHVTMTATKGISMFDAKDVKITNSRVLVSSGPAILLNQTSKLSVVGFEYGRGLLMRLAGNKTKDIEIKNTKLDGERSIEFGRGVSKDAVRIK